VDKFEYDRPEDKESKTNRAMLLGVLAIAALAAIFFGIYSR